MRGGARSLRSALVWLGRTLLPLPAASSDAAAIPSESGALFTDATMERMLASKQNCCGRDECESSRCCKEDDDDVGTTLIQDAPGSERQDHVSTHLATTRPDHCWKAFTVMLLFPSPTLCPSFRAFPTSVASYSIWAGDVCSLMAGTASCKRKMKDRSCVILRAGYQLMTHKHTQHILITGNGRDRLCTLLHSSRISLHVENVRN